MARERLDNAVRRWRAQARLSQGQLAVRVGTSRQTLNAIETGRTVPGTALALRLGAALGASVEDLFRVPVAPREVTATLAGPAPQGAPVRVRLAASAGRSTAIPLAASAWLSEADGIVCGGRGRRVRVRLFEPAGGAVETLVVAGCDPALPLIAWHFERAYPQYRLAWLPAGSQRALEWLRDDTAHVAGLHLRDPKTGEDNVPTARRVLGRRRAVVFGFATWEQGLIVAAGNPRGVRGVGDLGRRDLAIVNRESGSGARILLDAALARHGVPRSAVRGYERQASSHFAVAQAVALGFVDAGVGVRAAARAFGLDFVPLQLERYDLVMAPTAASRPAVQAFFETVRRPAVRADLGAIGDYDTSALGDTVAVLP